jgi:hypothetical protein
MVNTYLGYVGIAPYDSLNAARLSVGKPSTAATLAVAGSISTSVRTITTSSTLSVADSVVLANFAASGSVSLPLTSTAAGRQVTIKAIGTSTVGVVPQSPDLIDGSASPRWLVNRYQSLTVVSDGTNWNIVATN